MRIIISDSSVFSQVFVPDDKQSNFIVTVEKNITKKPEVISETVYKNLKPRGSRFEILYGLCKLHKHSIDNCPPFMSTFYNRLCRQSKRISYNVVKFLVPLLEPITQYAYCKKQF